MQKHESAKLENGLRVTTLPMPQVASATVLVGVGSGSRYEVARTNGLFHFLEHMAFKGTKKRPTAFDISAEVEGVGGLHNAFTGKELTGYWIKLSADHLEMAFDILSDMLVNSLFKEEEIEKEKGVIMEEINMREDDHPMKAAVGFYRLIFGDTPMGWDTAGEKETVSKFTRKDFQNLIGSYYFAPNMAVTVAGGVKTEEAERLAKKYFGGLPKTGKKVYKPVDLSHNKSRMQIFNRKTEQAHFWLGVPGISNSHPDRYVLRLLAAILGGGSSSRLFVNIRDKHGLAYYIESDVDHFLDSGLFIVAAGVKLDKAELALRLVIDELAELKNKQITEKEIRRAKDMIKGNTLLAMEDSRNVANRFSTQILLENKIRTVEETIELIEKVTAEDLKRVAGEVLKPESLYLSLVGPIKEEDKFRKLLATRF
jgi:predicted Zn-dependent peptidase